MSLDLRVFGWFFFANCDRTTIVNLNMDLCRGSICLIVRGSLPNKILENDKNEVSMHFSVKNSNTTKINLGGL